ncbi:uncharacterized protein LOC123310366 [Coccinella septempunctata]|uniref:uncharacterized protein LOC123310366 n=1 Tax=Coccinella septempunctata TaxID=41139 RepID=UPI001D073F0C|nr:uncharacterized protein LOC123310366 [Coccinella septempunctata]
MDDNLRTIVKNILTKNSFPIYLINRSIRTIQNKREENTSRYTPDDSTKSFHRFPFIDGLSNRIQKILGEINCTCAFYNVSTTNRFSSRLKEATKKDLLSSVVYKIPCLDCDRSYIGQTRQYLKDRIKQHKYDTRNINNKEKTALTYHVFGEGHNFNFDDVEVLDRESNGYQRNISDMISIRSNNTVNFREDVDNLSCFYDILLDTT